jgi:hypothetical protein
MSAMVMMTVEIIQTSSVNMLGRTSVWNIMVGASTFVSTQFSATTVHAELATSSTQMTTRNV